MQTNRCPTPSLVQTPDNMLRPSARFIDSFVSAKILPAASGRLCRRGRAADIARAPGLCIDAGSRFLRAKRIRSTDSLRRRSQSLFVIPSRTAFPSFLPYTTPAITGGEQEQDAVFRMFRKCGLRFGRSHYHSGNSAALIGFCEGGRAGNPMPQLSPCISIVRSDRYGGVARGYIQFKDRPSDRRHAYF